MFVYMPMEHATTTNENRTLNLHAQLLVNKREFHQLINHNDYGYGHMVNSVIYLMIYNYLNFVIS